MTGTTKSLGVEVGRFANATVGELLEWTDQLPIEFHISSKGLFIDLVDGEASRAPVIEIPAAMVPPKVKPKKKRENGAADRRRQNGRRPSIPPSMQRRIEKLAAKGKTTAAISKKTGVDYQVVWRLMKKTGAKSVNASSAPASIPRRMKRSGPSHSSVPTVKSGAQGASPRATGGAPGAGPTRKPSIGQASPAPKVAPLEVPRPMRISKETDQVRELAKRLNGGSEAAAVAAELRELDERCEECGEEFNAMGDCMNKDCGHYGPEETSLPVADCNGPRCTVIRAEAEVKEAEASVAAGAVEDQA